MFMSRTTTYVIVIAAMMFSTSALAEEGSPYPGGATGRGPGTYGEGPGRGGPGQDRESFDARRKERLIEELGLDEATASNVMKEMDAIRQEHRKLRELRMQYMDELKKELENPYPDESRLKEILARIEANMDSRQELRKRERDVINRHLSVEQQARYMVLRLERRQGGKRSMMLQGAGGQRGPGIGQATSGGGQRMPYGQQRTPR